MEAVREHWTDDRMDDLNHRVEEGFGRNEREFQAVRMEMRTEFAAVRSEMKAESSSMRGEICGLRDEVAALNRTLIQVAFGALGALIAGFTAVIATLLTQV